MNSHTSDLERPTLRVLLVGSGLLAARLARAVAASRHPLVALAEDGPCVSRAHRAWLWATRGRFTAQDALPHWANQVHIPLHFLDALDEASAEALREHNPDVLLVGGFSRRLPHRILQVPARAAVNCHPSLLPRYRGPDPIAAAILRGDPESGVTFHQMERRFDAGAVYRASAVPVAPDADWPALCHALCEEAGRQVVSVLDDIAAGSAPVPQNDEAATRAPRLRQEEAELDWRQSAVQLDRMIRAYAGQCYPRFKWRGHTVYVPRARVIQGNRAAPPGTLVRLRPRACVATGEGTLELLEALTFLPVPAPWPAPWSRLREGERLPVAARENS